LERIYVDLGPTNPDLHETIGKSTIEEIFIISILVLIFLSPKGNAESGKFLQRICHSARIMCFDL